jgi:hypothetical protein
MKCAGYWCHLLINNFLLGIEASITTCKQHFKSGEAVVQIATIKITVNNLLEIGPEESVGPLKPFLVDLIEGFQMILDTVVIIGSYRSICQGEYLRQFVCHIWS